MEKIENIFVGLSSIKSIICDIIPQKRKITDVSTKSDNYDIMTNKTRMHLNTAVSYFFNSHNIGF